MHLEKQRGGGEGWEVWVEVAKEGGGNKDFCISVNNKNKVEKENHSGSLEAGT